MVLTVGHFRKGYYCNIVRDYWCVHRKICSKVYKAARYGTTILLWDHIFAVFELWM